MVFYPNTAHMGTHIAESIERKVPKILTASRAKITDSRHNMSNGRLDFTTRSGTTQNLIMKSG